MPVPKLKKPEILESIRLMMNADINEACAVVLYEGETDRAFVEKYLDAESICFFESPSGKVGLDELLRETASKSYADRVIAIRDRDYSDPATYQPRLFAYDDCAMEVMLLHNGEVQNACKGCYQAEDKDNFPLQPMRRMAAFSVLRRRNEQEQLGLKLSRGVMVGCSGGDGPEMERTFQRLHVDEHLAACKAEAVALEDEELWAITNGHDICALLGASSRLGSGALGEEGYRSFLFATYRVSDFRETALYRSLAQYGKEHGLSIIRGEEGGEAS